MGVHTTVTITRASVPVNITPNPTVQIDTMSQEEASYYGGTGQHFRYDIYMQPLSPMVPYDIRFHDLLTDTTNIDPLTNNLMDYRVINVPEPFSDGHLEIVGDHKVGT